MVKLISKSSDVSDVEEKPAASGPGLDDLLREAQSDEQQGQQESQQQQAKQEKSEADTLAADLADVLEMAATVAGPGMWWLSPEDFERLWGKKVRAAIAGSGAEIMRRNGWTLGGVMSQYGPYIALAGTLGPSALATVHAYKREKARQLAPVQGGSDGSTSS